MMQTVMMLVGTLQFGVLNGGYRLLCSADAEEGKAINNVAYSCFAIIAVASLVAGLVVDGMFAANVALWITLIGISAGALTLIRSWVNNQMIAAGMLALLNRVTIWSALLSLLPLLLLDRMPLTACILSVAVQPALFVLVVLGAQPALRPGAWSLDHTLLRRIFTAGFYIFLSGMLLQLNAQIERWYVVRDLGLDALGHLYLAFLVINLFAIIPNAMQSLFLPRIVRAWDRRDGEAVSGDMRRLALGSIVYCVGAGLLLIFAAPPIISLILPRYADDLLYVYLILPGLILYTVGSAIGVIFNVLIRYRSYNIGFGAGTVLTVTAFAAAPLFAIRYSLEEVSVIKSAAYGLSGAIFLAGFWLLSREFEIFRFGARGKAEAR
ncbi:MAG: hypothetical protein V4618_04810 [Pseudomonadota bacterium]